MKSQIRAIGAQQKTHTPADHAAAQAQAAADVTPEQAEGMSRAGQVGAMSAEKPKQFDRVKFKQALHQKIEQLKADDAQKIKDGDLGAQLNNEVKGTVSAGEREAGGAIDGAVRQEPARAAGRPGEPLPAPAVGAVMDVDASRAVPPPVPESAVSVEAPAAVADRNLAAARISPTVVTAGGTDPEFQRAAVARSTANSAAASLPARVRSKERAVHVAAKGGLSAATAVGLSGMHSGRGSQLSAVLAKQVAGKAQQEAARKRITDQFGAIYTDTRTAVEARFTKLDEEVARTFDDGASDAKIAFYVFLGAKLLVHYVSGEFLVDWATGGDSKEEIFAEGRNAYARDLDLVIDRVADLVELGLADVVTIIAAGKKQIDAAVATIAPSDREVAREVAAGIHEQFTDLENSMEDRQNKLIDAVAAEYVAAQKEVDAAISVLRNPVGALIDAAVDAVGGVIETILKMKALLESALAKAREAVDLILADPIGFLGNLVAGVKQGVLNFVGNIGAHLKKGLLDWLFGALSGAGIQIPDRLDLSGLLSIVMQVLGLTWANIRQRAVAIVGEPVVKALEAGSEMVKIIVGKGLGGLWDYVKEQASAILDTLKESIGSMVIENVIKAGVKWLIGLLNPASAFVKACMAIVDIVSFVIDRGQQILEFVNAVLDSVLSIAKGQTDVAASAVESALAKSVPVAIGFLASLAGLGDLSNDIKKVINKVQAPVNKMIDWLIRKAAGLVGAAGRFLRGGGPEVTLHAADEDHTLSVSAADGKIEMRSSVAEPVEKKMRSRVETLNRARARKGKKLVGVEGALTNLHSQVRDAESKIGDRKGDDSKVNAKLAKLAIVVTELIIKIGHAEKDLGGPPVGLGAVRLHREQMGGRESDPDPAFHLQSEHVIPMGMISILYEKISGAILVDRRADENEYHTILIYKGAAERKTKGHWRGDLTLINMVKRLANGGKEITEGRGWFAREGPKRWGKSEWPQRLLKALGGKRVDSWDGFAEEVRSLKSRFVDEVLVWLPSIMSTFVLATVRAIKHDHDKNRKVRGQGGLPEPEESAVRSAAALEVQDIARVLSARIARVEL